MRRHFHEERQRENRSENERSAPSVERAAFAVSSAGHVRNGAPAGDTWGDSQAAGACRKRDVYSLPATLLHLQHTYIYKRRFCGKAHWACAGKGDQLSLCRERSRAALPLLL